MDWRLSIVVVVVLVEVMVGCGKQSAPSTKPVESKVAAIRCFEKHEAAIRTYVGNILNGRIAADGKGEYPVLDKLGECDAYRVRKVDECVVITFRFMPTDAVPELWYSPKGF